MKLGNLRFLKDIVIRAKTGCGCGRQSREADCKLEGGVVNVHESVLQHMEARKKEGKEYPFNPLLAETEFVVVGSLGKVLELETEKLKENITEVS